MFGIDPFETKDVVIDEVTFTIGIITYRKKMEIDAKLANLKIQEKVSDDNFSTDDVLGLNDLYIDVIRWSVKNHSGLKIKDKEIPFVADFSAGSVKSKSIVSEDTLEVYSVNGLLPKLFKECWQYNTLQAQEIKN
jgi:hypothetical protein